MNLTTAKHLKEHFPAADLDDFDTFYFSQGSDEAVAFIAVRGGMESIEVFTKGGYDPESLERRLFALVGKHRAKPAYYLPEPEPVLQMGVKEKGHLGEHIRVILSMVVLSIIELVLVLFLQQIGNGSNIILLTVLLCGMNILLYTALKPPPRRRES